MRKKKYALLLLLSMTMVLWSSCSKDNGSDEPTPAEEYEQPREIVFNAQMPVDDSSFTKPGTLNSVTVSSSDDVLNLVAKWKEGDKVQIFVRQKGKVYKVNQPCTIYDIGSNGKTCSFMFQLPSGVDAENDYDVIGVSGVETTNVSGSDVIAVSPMKRIALDSGGEAESPVWFVMTKNSSTTSYKAQFKHLGTYEVLHVKNNSKSSITFRHRGFEVNNKWYKVSDNTVLSDSYNPSISSTTGEVESDKSITIAAGGTGRILSWYIPSGAKINNAKLKATVGGSSVTTTDTKSSTVAIERGKTYQMTVTWDGEQLRFNETVSCPDNNHPHAIDLGLPSGTKWACCNIGAYAPSIFGNYYAWGETASKSYYEKSTYKWYEVYSHMGSWTYKLTKYCNSSSYGNNGFVDNKTELDPADDVAYVKWGSGWRMPSLTQIRELLDNTTWQWTTWNNINGQLLTSKINGASLFLPAAGCRIRSDFASVWDGLYWSRTLSTRSPDYASCLRFRSDSVYWHDLGLRSNGFSVRAVRVSQN